MPLYDTGWDMVLCVQRVRKELPKERPALCPQSRRNQLLPQLRQAGGGLMVKLVRRYPDSKTEDITDAFNRGVICGMEVCRGTCRNTQSDFDFMCSECGKCVDNGRVLGFNYCPNCGRRVVAGDA